MLPENSKDIPFEAKPPPSILDVSLAILERGVKEMPEVGYYNMYRMSSLDEGQTLLDPIELNKMYDPQVPFSEPTSERKAKAIMAIQEANRERDEIISYGVGDSMLGAVAQLGLEMVPQALSPTNYATGRLIGVGANALLGSILKGTTTASAAKSTYAQIWGRAAKETGENIVGNVATELAISEPATRAQQMEYEASSRLMMSVGAAFLLPTAAGAFRTIRKNFLNNLSVDVNAKLIGEVEAQLTAGKQPDISTSLIAASKASIDDFKFKLDEYSSMQKSMEQDILAREAAGEDVTMMRQSLDELGAERAELQKTIDEIESSNLPDEVERRKAANSPESDMGYNATEAMEIKKIIDEPKDIDNQDLDARAVEVEENIREELEGNKIDEEDLTPEDRAEILEAEKNIERLNKLKKYKPAADDFKTCMLGG